MRRAESGIRPEIVERSDDPYVGIRAKIKENFSLSEAVLKDPAASHRPRRSGERWERFDQRSMRSHLAEIKSLTDKRESWRGVNRAIINTALHAIGAWGYNSRLSFEPETQTLKLVRPRSDIEGDLVARITLKEHVPNVEIARTELESAWQFSPDEAAISRALGSLLDIQNFKLVIERSRPGGMSFEGGMPAEYRTIHYSCPIVDRESLQRLALADQVIPHFIQAVADRIKDLIINYTLPDWVAEGPTYKDGRYLFEVVEDIVYEKVAAYMDEHPELTRAVRDVNAQIDSSSLTPLICFARQKQLFGRPIENEYIETLTTVPLDPSVPHLSVDEVSLASPRQTRNREAIEIKLSAHYRIPFRFFFYPWRGVAISAQQCEFKHTLLERLAKRYGDSKQEHPKRPRETIKDLHYFLKLLGVEKGGFSGLDSDGQRDIIQNKLRELSVEFHPDRHSDEAAAATELAKEIGEARIFFKEFFGVKRI